MSVATEISTQVRSITDEQEILELLDILSDRLTEVRRYKSADAIRSMSVGDTVKVTGKLRGDAYKNATGEVTKVNRTRVVVRFSVDRHGRETPFPTPVTIPAEVLTVVDG